MKKIIKRLLLFTSAATIATSSIAYKLSHDTQTGFIKDLTDFFSVMMTFLLWLIEVFLLLLLKILKRL